MLLALPGIGCRSEGSPEPVVEQFVRAVNDRDVNRMLTCIDPRQERMARASFRLVEKLTGGSLPLEDLLELIPGLYQLLRNQLASDVLLTDVRVYRAKIDGAAAVVPVWLTVSRKTGPSQRNAPLRLHFGMTRFSEGWRIVSISSE